MRLRVSQAASDDLEGIWLYTTEKWSIEQADRYVNMILGGFNTIGRHPKTGRDFGHVREGYLGLKVGSHLIFYRVDEAHRTVEIIRVLHERMDIENRLTP